MNQMALADVVSVVQFSHSSLKTVNMYLKNIASMGRDLIEDTLMLVCLKIRQSQQYLRIQCRIVQHTEVFLREKQFSQRHLICDQ